QPGSSKKIFPSPSVSFIISYPSKFVYRIKRIIHFHSCTGRTVRAERFLSALLYDKIFYPYIIRTTLRPGEARFCAFSHPQPGKGGSVMMYLSHIYGKGKSR